MKKFSCLVLFCCAVSLLYGCGPTNPFGTVLVTGTVTVDSEPMEGITISFRPTGDGMSAIGQTDASGNFRLTTPGAPFGTGAVPGSYTVTFEKVESAPDAGPFGTPDEIGDAWRQAGGPSEPIYHIPRRYGDRNTAGFDPVEVVARGRNHFEFNLESQ